MSTPACAQAVDLADRHAVHALHHDHLGVAVVPEHLGDQHQVQALPCCGAAGPRWPPRAPGRARRAGTCRIRPPPRAASGACRRPTGNSTQPAIMRIRLRSFSITCSMPGRSTFTATSRSPAVAVLERGEVHLRDRGAGHRLALEAGEDRVDRPAEGALDGRDGHAGIERRHPVLQPRQFVGDVGRQQVAPGRQHLAELHEDRAQVFQRLAQALAARRAQIAPERKGCARPTSARAAGSC